MGGVVSFQEHRLNFEFDDYGLFQVAGGSTTGSGSITLFEANFNEQGSVDNALTKFDYYYDFTLGSNIALTLLDPGVVGVKYPINSALNLPNSVSEGATFSIATSPLWELDNAKISGTSLGFGELSWNLFLESEGAGFTDIGIGNVDAFFTEFSLLTLPDITLPDFDVNVPILTVSPDLTVEQEIIDALSLKLSPPDGASEERRFDGDPGQLPSLDLAIDDPLIELVLNPLKLTGLIPQLSALSFLSEEFERTILGYDVKGEYIFIEPTISGGYGLNQTYEFVPEGIETMVTIGGKNYFGDLGEIIEVVAPSTAGDMLEGTVTYTLDGDVNFSIGLAPIVSGAVEILSAELKIDDPDKPNTDPVELDYKLGPAAEFELSTAINLLNYNFMQGSFDAGALFEPIVYDFQIPIVDLASQPDGPQWQSQADLEAASGQFVGSLELAAPIYSGDGVVEFTVSLGGLTQAAQYNIAYIIDVSGSMGGSRIFNARNAYIELTKELQALGIADVANFAVIPFNSSANLFADLSADEAIARVATLGAGGGTSFGPALAQAASFFEQSNIGQANIAYFLSDGDGSGASDFLTALADVQAFGVGFGANLSSLNIIDSDTAVALTSSSQLLDVLTGATVQESEIDRIEIYLNGALAQTIGAEALTEGVLGLQFSGELSGLNTQAGAINDIAARVILNDGSIGGVVDITTASALNGTGISETANGVTITLGAAESVFDTSAYTDAPVTFFGNNVGNTVFASKSEGTFSLFGGDDYIYSSQAPGTTIDRLIDGGIGYDIVEYDHAFTADLVSEKGGLLVVGSNSDTLSNIEEIRFSNGSLDVESFSFSIMGTDESDLLEGTGADDILRSGAGSYDKISGGAGADSFVFGAETQNGVRERDVIVDYEVGVDEILLESGASIASMRDTRGQVVIFLEDDRDAIYVRGDGVSVDSLTISVLDDALQLV